MKELSEINLEVYSINIVLFYAFNTLIQKLYTVVVDVTHTVENN